MIQPVQCHLWNKELTRDDFNLKGNFLIVHMFEDEGPVYRRLLKCNECAQLYFYEFFNGTDEDSPRLSTLIPVKTEDDAWILARLEHRSILKYIPRLHKDWPAQREKAKIYWVKN